MFYFIIACLVLFVSSIVIFAYGKERFLYNNEDMFFALLLAFIFSSLWFITLPIAIIIGCAYLVVKLFKTTRTETKNESNTDD